MTMMLTQQENVVAFAEELTDVNLDSLFGGRGCGWACPLSGECTCTTGASVCRVCFTDSMQELQIEVLIEAVAARSQAASC
jgi:Type-A lantibiotic